MARKSKKEVMYDDICNALLSCNIIESIQSQYEDDLSEDEYQMLDDLADDIIDISAVFANKLIELRAKKAYCKSNS